jgi:hypothetical protein
MSRCLGRNSICPVAAGKGPSTDPERDIDRSERCILTHAGIRMAAATQN